MPRDQDQLISSVISVAQLMSSIITSVLREQDQLMSSVIRSMLHEDDQMMSSLIRSVLREDDQQMRQCKEASAA